jgi:hypothetical protein
MQKGVLKPGGRDGLNPPIYSLMSPTVLEEVARTKLAGLARGGLRPP